MRSLNYNYWYLAFLLCTFFFSPASISFAAIQPISSESRSYQDTIIYIDLNKQGMSISEFINEIALLDNNSTSPIHLLKQHLDSNLMIGMPEDIKKVLHYAKAFLQQHNNNNLTKEMLTTLSTITQELNNG